MPPISFPTDISADEGAQLQFEDESGQIRSDTDDIDSAQHYADRSSALKVVRPMRTALIFRERVLAPSETFILEQAKPLCRYRPILVGLRRTNPALQHSLPVVLLRNGDGPIDKFAASAFRKFPIGSGFFSRLQSLSPAIIHAHFAVDAVQAMAIAEKLDVPLIVSLHGFDITSTDEALKTSFSGRHFVRHRERLFEQALAFICVSQFLRQIAVNAGFPESKVRVHYTGVDCDRFSPADVPRDPDLILFVGRLVEKKGCGYLLRAMSLVQRDNPRARLEIIGDGPLRSSLEALARELGVRVTFRGTQGPDEVLRSMSRARILCNPSITASSGDMEGFGMVFAEAQAVSTPVVSFSHAAIPEVVSHGRTGLLCPEGNIDALSSALKTLLVDHALWSQMHQQARGWVKGNFDIARQTGKLEALYDDCIARYRHRVSSAQ
jgi:colanic acid/amylovoran biosynthesis glycosyltransferase